MAENVNVKVNRGHSIAAALYVCTGSSSHVQEVWAEGATVAEAFDSALEGLRTIMRPSLVAQDEARAAHDA